MSSDKASLLALFDILAEMEPAIGDLDGWSMVLRGLGDSQSDLDPHAVCMVADTMSKNLHVVRDLWRRALEIARSNQS